MVVDLQKSDPRWRRGSPRLARNMLLQPASLKLLTAGEEKENLILQQFSESVACMAALGINEYETSSRELDTCEAFRHIPPLTEVAAAALQLRLRLAVWDDDLDTVLAVLQESPSLVANVTCDPEDENAQAALSLAIQLRRLEIVQCLLEAGADILAGAGDGWRLEAHLPRAFPDSDVLLVDVAEAVGRQKWASWKENAVVLAERLRGFPDCDIALTWAFSTWVPAIGRLLPQDSVRVRKLGARLRVDYSLKSFSGLTWEQGHCSVLACPDKDGAVHFLDHDQAKVDSLERKLLRSHASVQERAKRQRRRPLKRGRLNGDNVTIEDSGLVANCGDFQNCKVYQMAGLEYTTLVLPRLAGTRDKDGASRWKGLVQLAKGMSGERGPGAGDGSAEMLEFETVFPDCQRASHAPVVEALPPASVAHVRRINADVLMSTEYPLTRNHFVAIADALAASDERYQTMKEFFDFFETKLPDGFPVQFTIPVLPALSATLSFTEAKLVGEQDASLFDVPLGFREAKPNKPEASRDPPVTTIHSDNSRNLRLAPHRSSWSTCI